MTYFYTYIIDIWLTLFQLKKLWIIPFTVVGNIIKNMLINLIQKIIFKKSHKQLLNTIRVYYQHVYKTTKRWELMISKLRYYLIFNVNSFFILTIFSNGLSNAIFFVLFFSALFLLYVTIFYPEWKNRGYIGPSSIIVYMEFEEVRTIP